MGLPRTTTAALHGHCALSFTSFTRDAGPGISRSSSEVTELEIVSALMERALRQVESESILYNVTALDPPKTAVKAQMLLLPHFTEEEKEAHRGEVICPRSPSWCEAGLGHGSRSGGGKLHPSVLPGRLEEEMSKHRSS